MVRIKICGITNYEDAYAAFSYGADAIGFVFAKSPRQVTVETVKSIIDKLPPYAVTVGVFVNEAERLVHEVARDCGLRCLQFHGDEEPGYCRNFKERYKYKIIKAMRIRDVNSLLPLKEYDVDAFLLDTFVSGSRGGTGVKFDWDLAVEAKRCGRPIILAGGVGPENIDEAIQRVSPYAIDVSSSVEYEPGRKDHNLMKALIERVYDLNRLGGGCYGIK